MFCNKRKWKSKKCQAVDITYKSCVPSEIDFCLINTIKKIKIYYIYVQLSCPWYQLITIYFIVDNSLNIIYISKVQNYDK